MIPVTCLDQERPGGGGGLCGVSTEHLRPLTNQRLIDKTRFFPRNKGNHGERNSECLEVTVGICRHADRACACVPAGFELCTSPTVSMQDRHVQRGSIVGCDTLAHFRSSGPMLEVKRLHRRITTLLLHSAGDLVINCKGASLITSAPPHTAEMQDIVLSLVMAPCITTTSSSW